MEKVVFKSDYFKDFTGTPRQFTFAAVSSDAIDAEVIEMDDLSFKVENVKKELRIGIAVQNPRDFLHENIELSEIIALGKAKKDKSCYAKLFVTNKGLINYKVVEALLEQEVEFFKQNPGKYIKGYNKDKELYQKDPEKYKEKFNVFK